MIINWGDAPFKAFITVTYPNGTCTVTGNGQSYTHTGGGTYTFTVKKKGTYTVKATDGASTVSPASHSVSISAGNETKSVSFSYTTTFITSSGAANVSFATSTTAGGTLDAKTSSGAYYLKSNISSSVGSEGFYRYTTNKYNLTGRKTIYFTVKVGSQYQTGLSVYVGTSPTTLTASKGAGGPTSYTTLSLDVSKLNGMHHIGFYISSWRGSNWETHDTTAYLQNVYMV